MMQKKNSPPTGGGDFRSTDLTHHLAVEVMQYLLPVLQKNRIFPKKIRFFEYLKTFGCAERIASNQWRIGMSQV